MQIKPNLDAKLLLIKQANQDLSTQGYSGSLSETSGDVVVSTPVTKPGVVDSGNDTTVEANTTVTFTYEGTKQLRYNYRRLNLDTLKTVNNITASSTDYFFKANEHDDQGAKLADYDSLLSKAMANKWNLGEKDLVNSELQSADLVKGVKVYNLLAKEDNYLVVGAVENVSVQSRDNRFGEAVISPNESVYFNFSSPLTGIDKDVLDLFMPYSATNIPSNFFMNVDHLDTATIHFGKVVNIGDYAFKNSITSLSNITLPEGVAIGEGAFYGAHTQNFSLAENISISLDALGTVDNLTVLGEATRLAEVVTTMPGGENTNYIYQKNQEHGSADTNNETFSVIKVKNSNTDIYVTKDELGTGGLATGQVSGFVNRLSDIKLSKDIDIIPPNFFNFFEGDSVDIKNVQRIQGFSFSSGFIEDLYLGDIDPTRIDDTAFSSTSITNIHVPTEEVKNKLMGIVAFSNSNLSNVPNWIVENPTTTDIPEELVSTGLNYNP